MPNLIIWSQNCFVYLEVPHFAILRSNTILILYYIYPDPLISILFDESISYASNSPIGKNIQ